MNELFFFLIILEWNLCIRLVNFGNDIGFCLENKGS